MARGGRIDTAVCAVLCAGTAFTGSMYLTGQVRQVRQVGQVGIIPDCDGIRWICQEIFHETPTQVIGLRFYRREYRGARSQSNQGSGAGVYESYSTATVSADLTRDCPRETAAGYIGKLN